MCTFAHVLVMMFVYSLQSYQKGLTPQTGASPIFYFSRLACACIHVHARDEVLADNNNQNYCLGEEAFEIFSYLCSAIECGCNNRTYLVKWLDYIHNLLIWNYKVTKNLALDQILTTLILLKINKINIYIGHGCYDSKFNELLV